MNIARKTVSVRAVLAVRHASGATAAAENSTTNNSAQNLSQRELREQAIAASLAQEEEQLAKIRAIRELRSQLLQKISSLNKSPVELLSSRFEALEAQLKKIPEKKVKQLDEELEEFLVSQMQIPLAEIANHPWSETPKATLNGDSKGSVGTDEATEATSPKLKSTMGSTYTNKFPGLRPTPEYKPYSEQELYLRQLQHSRQSGGLGSAVHDVYRASKDVKSPQDVSQTTIALLMAAGCHLGHSVQLYRSLTQPFIYGTYQGIHIIDLNETMTALKRASKVIRTVANLGGIIVYVGTTGNREQKRAIEEAARRLNGYYVSRRWLPGTITNFKEVTKQVDNQLRMEVNMGDEPTMRELDQESYSKVLKPDLVVILNPVENRNCINECISSRVPTIGLCDTNMEPSLLTYPIPCNDDLMRASSLITGVLLRSARDGVRERQALFAAQ